MSYLDKEPYEGQVQRTYENTAEARRVHVVDANGNEVPFQGLISNDMEGGGKISVGTTRVEVDFDGKTEVIRITADKDNTGTLYVGKVDVTNTGANAVDILQRGQWVEYDYDDSTNAIYVVASAASQNFWKGALL